MLTALDRALAVYCTHSKLDMHFTARKKIPGPTELCEFLQVVYAEAWQGNRERHII